MTWQSPIAPGMSWYEASVGERPEYPDLDGSTSADVAIIGGGLTGLQAAFNLARLGVSSREGPADAAARGLHRLATHAKEARGS